MKRCAILSIIAILAASSLILVNLASASTTKPSVPAFTLKFIDNSYIVPTTISTDPYTGENVTHPAHVTENKTIEVKIKNQLAPCLYNIRVKGHFEENWSDYPIFRSSDAIPSSSDLEYTVLSFTSNGNGEYESDPYYNTGFYAPSGSEIDVQMMAMIGYYNESIAFFRYYTFIGETSDWSPTQTLTISANPTQPTLQTQLPAPAFQLFVIIGTAVAVFAAVIAVAVLVYWKKRKRS